MRFIGVGAFVALVCGAGLAVHGSAARAQDAAEPSPTRSTPLIYSACDEALPNLRRDHRSGSPGAASLLGQLYEIGQCVAQDFERAAELYNEAAARHHEGAQMLLGRLHVLGLGVPQDLDRARQLFRRAALTLAEGGTRDYAEAAKFYLRARKMPELLAAQLSRFQEISDGPAEQQYEFALRWREGQDLPASREGYLNWLMRSALGRYPLAQYEFGKAGLAGEIGIYGAFDGAIWIWYAAQAGHVPAQIDLAGRFEIGADIRLSTVDALAWYLIAQLHGADVSESIERLNGRLAESERKDAMWRTRYGIGPQP